MNFVLPTDWGARINYANWADTPFIKDNVAIHWGGTHAPTWADGVEAEMAILRGWESYHLDSKGWRGIAYGYGVGASGTVYQLRGKNNYGAHQGDEDNDGISNNKEVVPIVAIMGEGSGGPTAEMWLGMRALYQYLIKQPWTDGDLKVFGHREIQPKATQCPGDIIMDGIKKGWVQMPPPTMEPTLEERIATMEKFVSDMRAL